MKCVFIVYNQANTERVEYMLDEPSRSRAAAAGTESPAAAPTPGRR